MADKSVDEHSSFIADWLQMLFAYSEPVEVLQRLNDLCKELIKMSHRCSGMNLNNMWEESGSNSTLDCINAKSFILLIYDCVFEQNLLWFFFPLNFWHWQNNLYLRSTYFSLYYAAFNCTWRLLSCHGIANVQSFKNNHSKLNIQAKTELKLLHVHGNSANFLYSWRVCDIAKNE